MKRLILVLFLTVLPFLKAAHIDLSAYPFSSTLRSDNTGDAVYQVFWDFDANSETSSFAVRVRTTGWVGFGLSPNGGMIGSDVVIGWVDGSSAVFFDDRYAVAEALPPIDASQDWTLVDGEEVDGYTILQFTRPWVTCDDRDRNIEANTARVVYSWNDVDPADANSAQYHGPTQRGSASLNLLGGQRIVPPDPADIQSFTIAVNNVTLPADDTTYWCYATQLPQEVREQELYITRYSPRITDNNFNFVHHMIIYLCTLDEVDVDTEGVCFTGDVGESVDRCTTSQIIAGWAVGGEDFVYPENVAFPIGGPGSQQHIVVQMHYDNPELRDGIVDSSGIKFFYTATRRQHDAGLLLIGHFVQNLMIVPPNVANYTIIGECSSECTSQYFPDGGITVFANLLHTHLVGHGLVLQHIRRNQQCGLTEELHPIDSNLQYDFDFQQFTHINEVTVLPGDSLLLNCFYSTDGRTGVTLGGPSTRDEMCLSFLAYYPRTNLSLCESVPQFPDAFVPFVTNYVPRSQQLAFANLDGTTGSLRNALNQLEWTDEQVQGLEQSLLSGPVISVCADESSEFTTSLSTLPEPQCRYQAPDPCNPNFTPTACCGGATLVTSFLFLAAMVAFAQIF